MLGPASVYSCFYRGAYCNVDSSLDGIKYGLGDMDCCSKRLGQFVSP